LPRKVDPDGGVVARRAAAKRVARSPCRMMSLTVAAADAHYATLLRERLGNTAPAHLATVGNVDLAFSKKTTPGKRRKELHPMNRARTDYE
jgi:hypothetical protein